jgi:signal peptidase I
MATSVDEGSNVKLDLAIDVLRSLGEARLAVSGSSMLPSLWPGDILEIHRVAAADISKGDIVVFAREDHLIVHRVLRMTRVGEHLTISTRGDRSARVDAPISDTELLGRVQSIKRGDRSINLHRTLSAHIASLILRRSELLTRLLLHLALVRRNSLSPERAWAN